MQPDHPFKDSPSSCNLTVFHSWLDHRCNLTTQTNTFKEVIMARSKRKMIRVLHPELFEKGKQAILKFEKEMQEKGIKGPETITDSKAAAIMFKTAISVWGAGDDLYVVSAKSNLAQCSALVSQLVDANTSEVIQVLNSWLGLKIAWRREGNVFYFSFEHDGKALEFRRIAVNEDQVSEYDLPTKPRKAGEVRRQDITETVEAEAMPAATLRALLRTSVEGLLPDRALEVTKLVEQEERNGIARMAELVDDRGLDASLSAITACD